MGQQPIEDQSANTQRQGRKIIDPVGPASKLSTGNASIDLVLGGGIPRNSLYIVTGPPGAGKTILAQQIAFDAARQGLTTIYFTNVSEPHSKLVEHISSFDFYHSDILGKKINLYNITSQVRDKGFQQTLDFIVDTVRTEKASLMVIDSFRGLKHVLEISPRDRGAIFELAARLSIMGCTTLLIGEYTPEEVQTDPEFAIADGIINLWYATQGVQERRTFRIAKMRGVKYLGGEHTFAITQSGVQVFPRQESLTQSPTYRASQERTSMGIDGLDTMMFGGPIRSSSTLITGSAGTGKTVLSLHFLAAGVASGEHGLMVSFQENADQLRMRANQFGLEESLGANNTTIHILSLSPVELDLDEAAARIREMVETHNIKRIVLDSVAELEFAVRDLERFDDFMASFVGYLRSREVTTLMIREIPQIFGNDLTISSRGLSYIVDNIILLRYIEVQAEIRRAITVLKIRGSNHDKGLREWKMDEGRVQIGERFENLAGLVTGIPRFIDPTQGHSTSELER